MARIRKLKVSFRLIQYPSFSYGKDVPYSQDVYTYMCVAGRQCVQWISCWFHFGTQVQIFQSVGQDRGCWPRRMGKGSIPV